MNSPQKYSANVFTKNIQAMNIPMKYSKAECYLRQLNAFPVIVSTLSVIFPSNISIAPFFCGQFMWNEKKAPIFSWFCMLPWKMSGLQNSGQYCYFNLLMQVFANILPVCILLRELMDIMENDSGECQHCNIE